MMKIFFRALDIDSLPLKIESKFPAFSIFILALMLLITSCAPSVAVTDTGPTPTAVIAGEPVTQPTVQIAALPKPTIAPFRFFLPTPGAEPVSGWRPPLYPVPWAVSAYDHFYFEIGRASCRERVYVSG